MQYLDSGTGETYSGTSDDSNSYEYDGSYSYYDDMYGDYYGITSSGSITTDETESVTSTEYDTTEDPDGSTTGGTTTGMSIDAGTSSDIEQNVDNTDIAQARGYETTGVNYENDLESAQEDINDGSGEVSDSTTDFLSVTESDLAGAIVNNDIAGTPKDTIENTVEKVNSLDFGFNLSDKISQWVNTYGKYGVAVGVAFVGLLLSFVVSK